jgi:hypothetical protein
MSLTPLISLSPRDPYFFGYDSENPDAIFGYGSLYFYGAYVSPSIWKLET